VNAAGSGSGYAVIWNGADAASAGIRQGFVAEAELLGMNLVADLSFSDHTAEAETLVAALQQCGADTVIVAAGDPVLAALLTAAEALSYAPSFIQVY
jgi:branched-chain amino acid transport system substrate-binding protein